MTRTPDALIKPELLVWARQSAGLGLDAAAAKLRVREDRLRSWETGEARPTIAQLRTAAKVYKRPLAVFYLPEPPLDFQPLRDYRRVPDAQLGQLSPGLLAVIRRAHAIREAALELRELADESVSPAPKLDEETTDPERYGAAARALLGVTLAQQAAWRDPRRALNAWLDAISRLDVLVLQTQSIAVQEMRGFSISTDRLPVVVLNGADFPRGRIFTLLHEFAHVLLLTDWNFLQEKEAEYRAAYKAFREEQKRKRREEERSGGPSYYRMKVRDLGRGFIESALDAYYRRAITGSDLSEYLEIKLNGLPKLEAELAATGGARD